MFWSKVALDDNGYLGGVYRSSGRRLTVVTGTTDVLESSSISQDEVQHIYEITEVKDIGLYVLAGWPWWIIRIETQPKSRFVVNVYEPEERQLVNVMQGSKGRKWRKRYSTIDKAVRRMGIQLRQLEETAWYT